MPVLVFEDIFWYSMLSSSHNGKIAVQSSSQCSIAGRQEGRKAGRQRGSEAARQQSSRAAGTESASQ